jgi:hypothetical protein
MTAPRRGVAYPRFAGVAGGCATTTLTTALAGIDAHVYRGKGRVDVLVCRPTMSSLSEAQVALAAMPYRPVLAVVADVPRAVSSAARARLRLTEPHTAEVVHVPFVPELRQLDQAHVQAEVAAWWSEDRPRWLREFAEAMTELRDAVLPLLETDLAAAQLAAQPAQAPAPAPSQAPALASAWRQIPPPAAAVPGPPAPLGRGR